MKNAIDLHPWELSRIGDYVEFITKYEKTGTWTVSIVEERTDGLDSSRMPTSTTTKTIKFILNRNNNRGISLDDFEKEVEKFKAGREYTRVEFSSDRIVVLVDQIGE